MYIMGLYRREGGENIMDTLNERIKTVRKNLGLSQKDFAEKIGISQRSVSWGEQPGNNVPDSTIKALCMAFRVSEIWLRDGTGPMYTAEPTFSLDQFVRDHHGTDQEIVIRNAYFELDPEFRRMVWDHFRGRFPASGPPGLDDVPGTPEELEGQCPPVKNPGSQVS